MSDGVTSNVKTQTIFRHYPFLPLAALLFLPGLTGCNTCVTFVSNPPTGTLGVVSNDPRTACTIPKVTMSAVHLRLGIPPVCTTCPGSGRPQHIFLAIRGIELHANASAKNDSPDWHELSLPALERKPLQVDLMESNAASGVQQPLIATAVIPAGIYHQLRLRFVPNQPAPDDQPSEKSRCGSGIFNCVVMADGSIHPLRLDPASPALLITPDRMDGAALPIFADTDTDLITEMALMWKLSSSDNESLQLVPTLSGSAKVLRVE